MADDRLGVSGTQSRKLSVVVDVEMISCSGSALAECDSRSSRQVDWIFLVQRQTAAAAAAAATPPALGSLPEIGQAAPQARKKALHGNGNSSIGTSGLREATGRARPRLPLPNEAKYSSTQLLREHSICHFMRLDLVFLYLLPDPDALDSSENTSAGSACSQRIGRRRVISCITSQWGKASPGEIGRRWSVHVPRPTPDSVQAALRSDQSAGFCASPLRGRARCSITDEETWNDDDGDDDNSMQARQARTDLSRQLFRSRTAQRSATAMLGSPFPSPGPAQGVDSASTAGRHRPKIPVRPRDLRDCGGSSDSQRQWQWQREWEAPVVCGLRAVR
ncbi:hypothetical protein B0T22DRAFT_437853 [Podospora appendiculata]|uniref:Uncharacterized protein n=1 Tax=Podospora appendiculata TaxID=314037 RepID=A0AAE0XJY1_9PEZI|nr:hypothetical protein B0T22DRAFT_437853 [Podospora appendiculata]